MMTTQGTGDDFGQPAYTGGVTAMQVAGLKNIRIPGGIWADQWNWSYAAIQLDVLPTALARDLPAALDTLLGAKPASDE